MTTPRETPKTDAAFAKHPTSPALCIDELLRCSSKLEHTVAEMREFVEDAAGNDCYHYEKWLHQKPCGKCQSCKARAILARLDGSKP